MSAIHLQIPLVHSLPTGPTATTYPSSDYISLDTVNNFLPSLHPKSKGSHKVTLSEELTWSARLHLYSLHVLALHTDLNWI